MVNPLFENADFRRGAKTGLTLGITLLTVFTGFGIYALQKGLEPGLAFLFTAVVFALPAQYAVVDLVGGSASVSQMILVGVLVNARFFVMSLTMTHFVSHERIKKLFPWIAYVAASTFLTSLFDKRRHADSDFFSFYRGVVFVAVPMTLVGTLLGLALKDTLPPILMFASSLFLPVYFTLLLVNDVKRKHEIAVVLISFFSTPAVETLIPGWGLVATAVSSATVVASFRLWTHQAA